MKSVFKHRDFSEDPLISKIINAINESGNHIVGDYLSIFQFFVKLGYDLTTGTKGGLAGRFDQTPQEFKKFIFDLCSDMSEKHIKFMEIFSELSKQETKVMMDESHTIQ